MTGKERAMLQPVAHPIVDGEVGHIDADLGDDGLRGPFPDPGGGAEPVTGPGERDPDLAGSSANHSASRTSLLRPGRIFTWWALTSFNPNARSFPVMTGTAPPGSGGAALQIGGHP